MNRGIGCCGRGLAISLTMGVMLWGVQSVHAQDCAQTSVGLTPLNDLGTGLYLGLYEGGLYAGGANIPPAGHLGEGLARASAIQPLDTLGDPDPAGRYVLMSIGMSNTTQEFCSQGTFPPCDAWTFMGQAASNSLVNTSTLAIVNAARGGQAAQNWTNPASPNYATAQQILQGMGLSEQQVRVVWVKQANPGPTQSLPSASADAFQLMQHLAGIARAAKARYPNLEMMLVSSRIYAGYATLSLNPEPYAYESAFSYKWLIEHQIDQMGGGSIDPLVGDLDYATITPWIAWGPYPWADGLVPRGDGTIWECVDFAGDGTHPDPPGEEKVGTMLLEYFLSSPWTRPWFVRELTACDADVNDDSSVDIEDVAFVIFRLGDNGVPGSLEGDADMNGIVDVNDVSYVIFRLGLSCA